MFVKQNSTQIQSDRFRFFRIFIRQQNVSVSVRVYVSVCVCVCVCVCVFKLDIWLSYCRLWVGKTTDGWVRSAVGGVVSEADWERQDSPLALSEQNRRHPSEKPRPVDGKNWWNVRSAARSFPSVTGQRFTRTRLPPSTPMFGLPNAESGIKIRELLADGRHGRDKRPINIVLRFSFNVVRGRWLVLWTPSDYPVFAFSLLLVDRGRRWRARAWAVRLFVTWPLPCWPLAPLPSVPHLTTSTFFSPILCSYIYRLAFVSSQGTGSTNIWALMPKHT